jgi:hypothetical protein
MILIQTSVEENTEMDTTIRHLRKEERTQPITDEQDYQVPYYNGQKNPMMPYVPEPDLPANFQSQQIVSRRRTDEIDIAFFQNIITQEKCPEHSGYNTRLCHEHGNYPKTKTSVVCLPLINMRPAVPDTMMPAMVKAKIMMDIVSENYVIFTADQQLYHMSCYVLWENQVLVKKLIRIRGPTQAVSVIHVKLTCSPCP